MWSKFLYWLLTRTLKVALILNRHLRVRDNKVFFECPEDPDQDPDVVFDIGAFFDAYFEEDT